MQDNLKTVSRDTSDPMQIKTAQQLHDLRASIEEDILKKVLETFEGRHVIFNILVKGDIYNLIESMSYDLAKSQRQIGRREVAQEVLTEALLVKSDVYIMMQREAGEFEEQFKIHLKAIEEEEDDA